VIATVSDPPELTADDLRRIADESVRLHDAFAARTASMEKLTYDDWHIAITTARVVPAPRGGNDVEQQTEEDGLRL